MYLVLALSTDDQHACYITVNLTKKCFFIIIKMLTCANQNLEVVPCMSLKQKEDQLVISKGGRNGLH